MTQQLIAIQTRTGFFDSIAQADQAIRRLLADGFLKAQLAVVCNAQLKKHFQVDVPDSNSPTPDAGTAVVKGGAVVASLGGLALAATVGTGGAGILDAALLIGGGAVAGGFSNLIRSNGYEDESDDASKLAIARGQIVVGVEVNGKDENDQAKNAERILTESGASQLISTPAQEVLSS